MGILSYTGWNINQKSARNFNRKKKNHNGLYQAPTQRVHPRGLVSEPGNWLGLCGWCILGRSRRLLPAFYATLRLVLPEAAASGTSYVHLFSMLWPVPLAGLLYLANRHRPTAPTGSSAQILAATWKNWKEAGVKRRYWRENGRLPAA